MKIVICCYLRNEMPFFPYFLRHYSTFADKIVIYDDGSDDGTVDAAKANSLVELRAYPKGNSQTSQFDDIAMVQFASSEYRRFKDYDWLMWPDADELIYHPDMRGELGRQLEAGADVIAPIGYNMQSDHFPTTDGQVYDEVFMGTHDGFCSKPVVCRPSVDHKGWSPGKHALARIVPGFKIVLGHTIVPSMKLLHFRWLGREYWELRNARNLSRFSPQQHGTGYGPHVAYKDYTGYGSQRMHLDAVAHLVEVLKT